jgi:hypothetical protein
MESGNTQSARGQHPAPLTRPRRVWDDITQTWIEPHVRRRNLLGRWSRLLGNEPMAQLVFDFAKRTA